MSYFVTYKNLLLVEAILLFAHFWLGMSTNLFIAIPLDMPLSFLSYSGGLEVLAHIVNGVLVLSVAVALLIYGLKLNAVNQLSKLSNWR
jgi:hypothetical protein